MNPRKRIPATLTAILAILALTACGETPKGDFWEPISTLKAFLLYHPKWRSERRYRKASA